ncbi:MAG: hypothetical protein QW146_06770 [Candidatus Bathyarchaeia archaeon]
MEKWKIVSIAVLSGLAFAILITAVYSHMGGWNIYGYSPTYGNYGAYPTYPANPAYPAYPAYPYGGRGCHGRNGWNGFGIPTYPAYPNTPTAPITIDKAAEIAQRYLISLNNPDLAVSEIEEYSLNFYVQYYERSTGIGAFEMLIDKYTGSIYPEHGPNMMWNTKYGMHSGTGGWYGMHGMMGGYNWYGAAPTSTMPVTVDQAKVYAQQYLNTYYPGTTVGEVKPFYGYYHVMVELNGQPYGMLSVNGYTGQVWYHTWHGTFIQELEFD